MQLRRLASLFILVIATALVTLCFFIDDEYKPPDNVISTSTSASMIDTSIIRSLTEPSDNDVRSGNKNTPILQEDYIVDCGEPDYEQLKVDFEAAEEYFQSLNPSQNWYCKWEYYKCYRD